MGVRRTGFILAVTTAAILAGCGGSSSPKAAAPPQSFYGSAPTTIPGPSRATVAGWAAAWCSVQPGATVAELKAAMGPPTQDASNDPTDPSMSWSAYQFMFNAFIGVDGNIHQLDINDIETPGVTYPCATTRVEQG